ncbi:site-specific integrase [Raineyella sp.]|uniref:tyrosine-type recombinase/integrase n=1 Tax=Raineyella sp. TaxID=1911550 RepID=UPI002B20AFFE|nr:site-specific integrase [Raineyella sp.]MEA5155753.1 site-specific integrase [Raineyella sp.]
MGFTRPYETSAGKRLWEARYRRPDGRTARKASFRTKREAEAFLATVEVSKLQGAYIAPSDAQITIGALGADWLVAHEAAVKPSAFYSDASAWRVHVEPKWGKRKVGSIRHTEIAAWVAELAAARSATTVKRAHGVLAAILDGAVRDRRIPSNPAREVKTPRKTGKARAYLTHEQVERLAQESRYPDVVRFVAYTGLRWGEMAGLRVRHVDRARRRISVEENAVFVGGRVRVGTPKTHERRTVPYPPFLDEAIERATAHRGADDLVWPADDDGGYLSSGKSGTGWFAGAVKRVVTADMAAVDAARAAGQPEPPVTPYVTPHDLRHTAASLAISAGANVKAVQRMLGHASAAMTLDTYADLFDDDLDAVASALDAARAERLALS